MPMFIEDNNRKLLIILAITVPSSKYCQIQEKKNSKVLVFAKEMKPYK
ncbi:hypothetical protein DOY81_009582 [Sarcophaga bullata]|nr:hypothetical protein DOY81_009582 [Sarcophaga bullata]